MTRNPGPPSTLLSSEISGSLLHSSLYNRNPQSPDQSICLQKVLNFTECKTGRQGVHVSFPGIAHEGSGGTNWKLKL